MLFSELNEAQYAAATAPFCPVLVLAGAGAGKTRVVSYRILRLIQQGISPNKILVMTFTNKAARELDERIFHMMSQSLSIEHRPMICTFHSLGVFILRRSIHKLNRSPNFIIYDQNDSEKLIKQCLQELNLKKNLSGTVQYYISRAKNALLYPEDMDPREYEEPIVPIYQNYQKKLLEANALDFDDLLFLPVRLFQESPETLEEYQHLWDALLIDEYQDTNHAQYVIAGAIAKRHHNIFAVGDPDQSIYSWRGANIHNILNFEKDYPEALLVRLEDNYRSHGNILEAANALIANNESRFKKILRSVKGPGEKIRLFIGRTDKDEADFVADEIWSLHKNHGIPLRDFCIFYRTNFQSRTFEDALLRRRVPYEIIGGISFYKRKEINDIIAFLRLITSDRDYVAFERTINLPKRGLGPSSVSSIIEFSSKENLPVLSACKKILEEKSLKLGKKQKEGLQSFISLIDSLRERIKKLPLHELLVETVRLSKYFDVLKEDPDTFEDRKSNIEELISKTYEWAEQNPSGGLEAFLDDLALKSSTDETSLSGDRLNLMTIHNGKGLEFKIAFLVGLEENLFPHANSKGNYENLEEERRLCYVGITRAQDLLYLTAAQTRFLWGSIRAMKPSRFLREIPIDYLVQMR
ncbi:ATP-dependent helicase [Chlamydiifrater phoenicopteri]|uniref:ATP-dependent helicase n=1 Tax=Chlamydiifrater phoenicopteri TaxID=2681469 RepID=UPI001BD19CBC|nr:UvrD-helicase domain-containing protein [Chlamydiifrater phoenicopteri]